MSDYYIILFKVVQQNAIFQKNKLYYSTLENNLYSEYKQSLAADATDEWASKGIAIINEALEGGKVIDDKSFLNGNANLFNN